ncbi:hypothetical protein SynROS8604_02415 [Synechococcus sp. ROS8604]|nr:hypothetical protein SynROS8604_02415 [Synechococcus sp. ROS8604]
MPMASKLDQSNSRVNQGWIDGGGNRVREPREITTDFLYHAPLSSRSAIDRSAHLYATTATAPASRQSHTEKIHEKPWDQGKAHQANNELQNF